MESSLKTNSHMPFSPHLRKRLQTLFHFPKRLGKSRQGAPVFAIQSTPSTNVDFSGKQPPWRGKYSRKKPPLNHVFTLAILIHSRGGDEEMYIVETLAKNRRLYPREGKGFKTIEGKGFKTIGGN